MQHEHFALVILSIFQPEHLIILALVLLLMFGGKKIPELMKGIGKGMKEFKDAQNGEGTSDNNSQPTNTNTNSNTYGGSSDKPRV